MLADLRADQIPKPELSALVRQATAAARPGLAAFEQAELASRPVHSPKVAAVAASRRPGLPGSSTCTSVRSPRNRNCPTSRPDAIEDDLNKALEAAGAEVGKATEETDGELASELAPACWDIPGLRGLLPVAALPPRPTIIGIAATAETDAYRFMGLSEANAQMWGELLVPIGFCRGYICRLGRYDRQPYSSLCSWRKSRRGPRQIRSLRWKVRENLSVDINDSPLYRRWCEARQETVEYIALTWSWASSTESARKLSNHQHRNSSESRWRRPSNAKLMLPGQLFAEWLDDSAPV